MLAVHQLEAARTAALEALAIERTVAARDPKDLTEQALLAEMLATASQAADALHSFEQAFTLLQDAEKIAAQAFAKTLEELTSVIPLARVQTLLAEHWKRHGDLEQARQWQSKAQHLWSDLSEQNEFVRSQRLALARTSF